MTTTAIPDWDGRGVLPPFLNSPIEADGISPFLVSLVDIIERFGTNRERLIILGGMLRYRAELHAIGLVRGFQWVDGSFMENIELLEQREPQDIDVVSFFHLPDGKTQIDILDGYRHLFSRKHTKPAFKVDAFPVVLTDLAQEHLVERSVYWYSLWGHRRNKSWKGFLQIDMAPTEDADAANLLKQLQQQMAGGES